MSMWLWRLRNRARTSYQFEETPWKWDPRILHFSHFLPSSILESGEGLQSHCWLDDWHGTYQRYLRYSNKIGIIQLGVPSAIIWTMFQLASANRYKVDLLEQVSARINSMLKSMSARWNYHILNTVVPRLWRCDKLWSKIMGFSSAIIPFDRCYHVTTIHSQRIC